MKILKSPASRAFAAGFGSVVSIFPTGQIERFSRVHSVEQRMALNFAAVGMHIRSAMGKFDHVKEEAAKGRAAK